jgi:predicted ArsR family transcriptional regulator
MSDHEYGANVRADDPWTSFAAARAAAGFADSQCGRILCALTQHGPQSKDQLAARLGLDGVAVARRLSDLQRRGKAEPTEDKRKSGAGRWERVWRAVD